MIEVKKIPEDYAKEYGSHVSIVKCDGCATQARIQQSFRTTDAVELEKLLIENNWLTKGDKHFCCEEHMRNYLKANS